MFLCGVAIAFLGSACHAPTVMLANIIATPAELAYNLYYAVIHTHPFNSFHIINSLPDFVFGLSLT